MCGKLMVGVCLLLVGCAGSPVSNERNARVAYEQSVADYRACLSASGARPQTCEAKRLVMETDERHWQNTQGRLGGAPIVIQGR